MKLKLIAVGLLLATSSARAFADPKSIFDSQPEDPSTATPKKTDRKPAPPAPPTPRPADPETPAPAPADDSNDLKAQLLELQNENAELRAKIRQLTDSLAAYESKSAPKDKDVAKDAAKDAAKDKAQLEREARIAAAKQKAEQKAENDRLAKIKPGISLIQAETLAHNKAVVTSSEYVHVKPHAGYFGPLEVRKQTCTLAYTKGGEEKQFLLAVIEGTVTEVGMP